MARYVAYRETDIQPATQVWTFIGAFLGISGIGFLQSSKLSYNDSVFLIGSFGASAVLVFGAPNSPLSKTRNLIGGHVLSAIIGVTIQKLLPGDLWLPAALAVSLAIVVMQITKTLHPPGGATALIAVIGSEKVKALGYMYVLSPVLAGAIILFAISWILAIVAKNKHVSKRLNGNDRTKR